MNSSFRKYKKKILLNQEFSQEKNKSASLISNEDESKQSTFYMDEQFLLTKSLINNSTQMSVNKKYFPGVKNRKPMKFSLRKTDLLDLNNKEKSFNASFSKSPNIKLIPTINFTGKNKTKFPIVKNNLIVSLNNELSRVSVIYGKENSFKKFTDNPLTNHYHEQKNYNAYEIAKMNELREVNYRPKLKPLVMTKESTIRKLSQSIFFLK